MKSYISIILAIIVATTSLTSCFEEKEATDYSGMSMITNATLGTLKRHVFYKLADGRDSAAVFNITGALYPLTIDQVSHHIFNPDSLPAHTMPDKVVLSAINAQGTLAIRSLTSGKDTIYAPADTIDLSQPRLLTVYGYDGDSQTTYTLEIRIHKEMPDSMQWHNIETANLPANLRDLHMETRGDSLIVWGNDGEQTWCYWANRNFPEAWRGDIISPSSAPLTQGIVKQGTTFFGLNTTDIVSSTDGLQWQRVAQRPAALNALAGSTSRSLYATGTGGFLRSTDGGHAWVVDQNDAPDSVAVTSLSAITQTTRTNAMVEEIILVGNAADGRTVAWKRNEMKDPESEDVVKFTWNYLTPGHNNRDALPHRTDMCMATYDEAALMLGRNGSKPAFLMSYDNGRTWNDTIVTTPAIAPEATSMAMTVDAENVIWVACSGTSQLWRGRLNRLGWRDEELVFTRTRRQQ